MLISDYKIGPGPEVPSSPGNWTIQQYSNEKERKKKTITERIIVSYQSGLPIEIVKFLNDCPLSERVRVFHDPADQQRPYDIAPSI